MSTRRVDMDRLQELVRLHRMGTGAREVARILCMSPTTERTYRAALADEGLLAGSPEDVPLAEVLRATVEKRLPLATPPQVCSSRTSTSMSTDACRIVWTCALARRWRTNKTLIKPKQK